MTRSIVLGIAVEIVTCVQIGKAENQTKRRKKMINNRLIYDNVKALSAYKGIKIGDIERSCGLQAGYISRFARDSIQHVRLELILAFAKAFDVTVEELVEVDMAEKINAEIREREIKELEQKLEELKNGQ